MRIIIALLVFFMPFSLFAQINAGEPDDQDFHVFEGGISAGFNLSQVDGDDLAGFNKMGIQAGPILHINWTRNWSTSFEILFTQKGSRTRPDPNSINTYKLTMNYAEVPVLMNYNDKNRLIFQAGLAYGRLFSVDEKINGYTNTNNDAFYSDELSYVIGGTILVGEKKHFGANVRYQGSITTVGESSNANVVGLVNRLIAFRATYYF